MSELVAESASKVFTGLQSVFPMVTVYSFLHFNLLPSELAKVVTPGAGVRAMTTKIYGEKAVGMGGIHFGERHLPI